MRTAATGRRIGLRTVARAQIAYWAVTALWPLVHMRSFERVSGPKREHWLVRTVSVLLLAIAAALTERLVSGRPLSDARALGVASTGGVGLVSLLGPWLARISPIYLLDAALDLALAAAWWRGEDD